jgi:hypothetical protein
MVYDLTAVRTYVRMPDYRYNVTEYDVRRGSPDPEATTHSAPSQNFIIPTKAFWTNCRYDGQGATAEVGGKLAGASTGGAAPLDAPSGSRHRFSPAPSGRP